MSDESYFIEESYACCGGLFLRIGLGHAEVVVDDNIVAVCEMDARIFSGGQQ
jgi:hypothetical protein